MKRLGGGGELGLLQNTHTLRALAGCFLLVENAAALGHSFFLSVQHRQLLPRRQQVLQRHSGKDPSRVRQSM
jgi:hypothetical protein